MFNHEKLSNIIEAYKEYFPTHWKNEAYKWEAVKRFQDKWDIDAEDFAAMFLEATDRTVNLLTNMNNYPRGMIGVYAEQDPETVRGMFRTLFDESKVLTERMAEFQNKAAELLAKDNDDQRKNHYQSTNAISTYLWLRYPDKYFIYKYTEAKAFTKAIDSDYVPKKGGYYRTVEECYALYNEISQILRQDESLTKMFEEAVNDKCYPDPNRITMTVDLGFFVSRFYNKKETPSEPTEEDWFPKESEYTPGFSVEDWKELLKDRTVFNDDSLKVMKRFLDYGGEATCKELSVKYGKSHNYYNMTSSNLAKRIINKTNCPVMDRNATNSRYWPVLYLGHSQKSDGDGLYLWRLRSELKQALQQTNLDNIPLYETEDNENEAIEKETNENEAPPTDGAKSVNYWWLNASPKIWTFSSIAVGEEIDYSLYNDNGNKRRIFQNFLDAKVGDLVIGYESNPVKQVVALAQVSRENDGTHVYFRKLESLSEPIDYNTLKQCPELAQMECFVNSQGSLFKLTKDEYDFIIDMIRENNATEIQQDTIPLYTKQDFLDQVYMDEDHLNTLFTLLRSKKNLILQGAPGVGKTFCAKRLAYAMMGEKDDSRIEFIQFHQNYSYEDFIMGYKPQDNGFKLVNGIFYQFCMKVSNQPDKEFFFIIDEINRGNMSKIFGELLLLIEKDYRGTKATLAYNGLPFSVPGNLYIIGMMNTADRSLAMIDYALRRRFSFYEMEPGFHSDGFKAYQKSLNNETFDLLIEQVIALNREISNDDSLGSGFRIGHSYFCGQTECTEEWMKSVVYYDIIPMLQEYWFDDKKKRELWENNLSGIFND